MRNTICCTLLFLACTLALHAGDTIRVLCIGNSFSVDAVEHNLYELGRADSVEFIIGNLYYGGCTLQQHYTLWQKHRGVYSYQKIVGGEKTSTPRYLLDKALQDEPWDYISLQQGSPLSGKAASYEPFLSLLLTHVRKVCPHSKMVWHMTWAYQQDSPNPNFGIYGNNQQTMYDSIMTCIHQQVEPQGFDIIVRSGEAIQIARMSSLGDNFCRDGSHMDFLRGRYTVACTWYEALTGNPVLENPYMPILMPLEEQEICQLAAHLACVSDTLPVTPYPNTADEDYENEPENEETGEVNTPANEQKSTDKEDPFFD